MNDRELNIALREMARDTGLCDEWYGKWGDDDTIDMCLDRYIKGFDFSVKNNWPSLEFCRKNFRKEDLNRHNIYLDQEISLEYVDSGYYVFLGNSKANVRVNGFKAVSVYCRHDSEVNVSAFDGARVFVTYYDSSHGKCNSDTWSHVRRYDRNI